jgi:predicted lipoprotein with Yx(FWY)xxD motif
VRKTWIFAASAAAALVLAGCGSGSTSASSGSSSSSGSSAAPSGSSTAAATDLAAWESPLGTIVVDGKGRTVYAFDKDTAGAETSACSGQCVSLWPALTTTSSTPSVSGVTGEVGTAPAADGTQQVTLDGHRLYTFSGDSDAQQVNGQGFMGLWWVLAPDGTKVTDTASSPSSSSSSSAPVQGPTY